MISACCDYLTGEFCVLALARQFAEAILSSSISWAFTYVLLTYSVKLFENMASVWAPVPQRYLPSNLVRKQFGFDLFASFYAEE